jgi:hypothetical protein
MSATLADRRLRRLPLAGTSGHSPGPKARPPAVACHRLPGEFTGRAPPGGSPIYPVSRAMSRAAAKPGRSPCPDDIRAARQFQSSRRFKVKLDAGVLNMTPNHARYVA